MLTWFGSLSNRLKVQLIIVFLATFGAGFIIDFTIINNHADEVKIFSNEERSIVSPAFDNPLQACEFYKKDSFKIDYPYIVIDKNVNEVSSVRAIAYEAYWKGIKCVITDEGRIELHGIEKTLHEVEARLSDEIDYKHIANGYGIYKSKLIFDTDGRIIDRRVMFDMHLDETNSKYEHLEIKKMDEKDLKSKILELKGKNRQDEEYKDKVLNLLLINPVKELPYNKLNEDYKKEIHKYISKRQKLHEGLEKGCGVISTGPEKLTNTFHKTKIAFLCQTHVRVMVRQPGSI